MHFFSKLLFSLLLFLSFNMLGQDQYDLSQQPFESIRDSINKYIFSDISKTQEAADAFIKKAKREGNKEKQWLGLEAKGICYSRNRKLELAQEQFELMLRFAKENNLKPLVARSYLLAGDIQLGVASTAKALELYNKSLAIAEELEEVDLREKALLSISYLLSINGDIDAAINIHKKTIDLYKNKPIDSIYTIKIKNSALSQEYSVLSALFLKDKVLDSATYYNEQIVAQKIATDSCSLAYYYGNKGEIDYFEKKFTSAKKNFLLALENCHPDYDLFELNMAYKFGKVALGSGYFEEAKQILRGGLDDYKVTPSEEGYMDDYYKLLAEAYKQTGDLENANYYFEKYINSTSEFSKLKGDVSEYLKKEEIKKFKKELQTLEAEKEQQKSYLNYLFLGATLVILALLFFLLKFYRDKKQNEAKFEALVTKIKAAEKPKDIIDTKDEELEEKNSNEVPEETQQQILIGLQKLEEKEYYLKQECNSYNVAKKINTNTSYLSKVINSHYGKNFNTYINDLRINYAIVRLKDDVIFRSYSIQSIAEELGYKSADSFTKYFKKDTGLNPSFYIKEIKNVA